VGKLKRRRLLGSPRHRQVDNIKVDLEDVEFGGMDGIDLSHDRDKWWALVNAIMDLQFP
jgi:hypothetical protein